MQYAIHYYLVVSLRHYIIYLYVEYLFSPGKTHTMLGTDHNALTLGVMPCAISWLFKLIDQQKDKTGARFSVRVSAVEVSCRSEKSRDLLAKVAQGMLGLFLHFVSRTTLIYLD